ncbi:RagB/SusD family nutrient uptake outer membrane protein [Pedobacter sp. MC2016-15]|uniref:RagB/SusD family nutrient uptake outer membrane protein n=1 Tax=Pedobacter sp. MC2016-15 TaxID=2994473 RepID=UPI0022461069|nr:RagB/SusD family nutrient uptake outer membrane protein [Pedobacter sp. MC2016-15]MCX2479378.1 RagB/SusD family nutrient uptake outer membrane protein [Pedobacter sp. MC2016-15]
MKKLIRHSYVKVSMMLMTATFSSCKKFVELGAPPTQVVLEDAFKTDASATSATLGMYTFVNTSGNGYLANHHFYTGVSSDDLQYNAASDPSIQELANNAILNTNGYTLSNWSLSYSAIKNANNCITGLEASNTLTPAVKSQLLGEAKTFRAFCYFQLVNIFGGVPLVLADGQDAFNKALLPRSTVAEVYAQIVKDLTEAQALLPVAYAGTLRGRINKYTATALLARVYLYLKDYTNADVQATQVISSGTYSLPAPELAFVNSSNEILWQIATNLGISIQGASYLTPVNVIPTYTLGDVIYRSFESPADLRRSNWTIVKNIGGKTYYGITKYKVSAGSGNEYNVVLRLAEVYLIRAEARAQLNNLAGARADLNTVRTRAGLPTLSTTLTQPEVLVAVEQERKVELFGEWGHRWFDLKRTDRAVQVLTGLKPAFKTTSLLFPIPQSQIIANTNLTQNPGY